MYVCLCKGVTDNMLRSTKKSGLSNKEILKKFGVGSDCGICLISALEQLDAQTASRNKTQPFKRNNPSFLYLFYCLT